MATRIDREKSIISQVAAKEAAAIEVAYITAGGDFDVERFQKNHTTIFEKIELEATVVLSEDEVAQALQQVNQVFPGAQNVTGSPQQRRQRQTYRTPEGVELIDPLVIDGQVVPLPAWFADQRAKSKCDPNEPLYDNRGHLEAFGGSRTGNLPWFRGQRTKQGIWPPRNG